MRKRSEVLPSAERVVESMSKASEAIFEAAAKTTTAMDVEFEREAEERIASIPTNVGNEDATGTTVTVTWAEEQFQPVAFNTFRVGPFAASTQVRAGETIAQATVRLHVELDVAAQQILHEKSAAYLRSLKGIAEQAGRTR